MRLSVYVQTKEGEVYEITSKGKSIKPLEIEPIKVNNMKNVYHNTTQLRGEELNEAIRAAMNQDEKIYIWFQNHPDGEYTPSQVHQAIFDEATPLTSTRRSITNLTKRGKLQKTDEQERGIYGRPENKWCLFRWDLTKGDDGLD